MTDGTIPASERCDRRLVELLTAARGSENIVFNARVLRQPSNRPTRRRSVQLRLRSDAGPLRDRTAERLVGRDRWFRSLSELRELETGRQRPGRRSRAARRDASRLLESP